MLWLWKSQRPHGIKVEDPEPETVLGRFGFGQYKNGGDNVKDFMY